MKITGLKLNNFRCFEDFKVDFAKEHNIHVIIAENMVGKSALMRALCIAVNGYVNGLLTIPRYGIERMDHRIIGHNVISDISLDSSIEVEALIGDEKGIIQKAHWKKFKDKPYQDRTKTVLFNKQADPAKLAKKVYEQVTLKNAHLPLINFIGTEYIHVLSSETDKFSLDGDAIQGYRDCLYDKSIKKFLFDWLGRIDGIIGEAERKKIVANAYGSLPTDAWFVFQKAVKSLLPDIRGFEWLEDKKQPIFEFTNGDMRLFDMLSDGYRYLILLAGELATRSIILNKHLGQKVLETISGIVLIDEFGIHLHPSLQNEALRRLQATFPKVQFILSTHSPLLINGMKKEQIHLLEMDEMGKRTVRHPEEDVIGLGAEGILRMIFGLDTTFDTTSIGWNEEYKVLFTKKTTGTLSEQERERFVKLSKQLAPLRLDPTLQVTEEDTLTRLVRENMAHRSKSLMSQDIHVPKNMPQQVDTILDNLFKTA